jgi:hypothetical protein
MNIYARTPNLLKTKNVEHQKCISNPLTTFVLECNHFNSLGKMFNHNQHVSIITNSSTQWPSKIQNSINI